MIWESTPWKNALLKDAGKLERTAKNRAFREDQQIRIERTIFIAAYSIRKLFEAEKLSTALKDTFAECLKYPRTGSSLHRLNWHRLDEHYDFPAASPMRVNVRDLMNEIIHSYLFAPFVEGDACNGFGVASDRNKDKQLTFVPLPEFCRLMREIGNDDPSRAEFTRGPLGDWKVSLS